MSVGSVEEFHKRNARLIERLYAEGRPERWHLSQAEFAAVLHRSAHGRFADGPAIDAAEVERYLETLHVADLALAAACERGTQEAWIEFLGRFRPLLFGSALSLAREQAHAQEITDSLYAELYGLEERDGRRRSLFQYFHGRSSLATWLRSVVARTFVDGYRANERGRTLKVRLADEVAREAPIGSPPSDPDRARLLDLLRRSLSSALAALEARNRLRLSYYYVQSLTLAQVGRLLGEHEATVSRKLAATRAELRTEVERRLKSEHGLGPEDVRACYEAALECWPFELEKELAAAR